MLNFICQLHMHGQELFKIITLNINARQDENQFKLFLAYHLH